MIRDHSRNYLWHTCDATIKLVRSQSVVVHNNHQEGDWEDRLADTGENSLTASRIKKIGPYLHEEEILLATYANGVGNVDVNGSIAAHLTSGKVCTISAVRSPGRFGELRFGQTNSIESFNEKPKAEGGYINGGFMVCSRKLFEYLPSVEKMMLEQEFTLLNDLWQSGVAPWKVW